MSMRTINIDLTKRIKTMKIAQYSHMIANFTNIFVFVSIGSTRCNFFLSKTCTQTREKTAIQFDCGLNQFSDLIF